MESMDAKTLLDQIRKDLAEAGIDFVPSDKEVKDFLNTVGVLLITQGAANNSLKKIEMGRRLLMDAESRKVDKNKQMIEPALLLSDKSDFEVAISARHGIN